MSWPRAVLAMSRPTQVALIAVIFANGALLATWRAGSATGSDLLAAGPAFVVLLVVSVAVHMANEAADHETDRLTRRTPFSGGSGAMAASGLDPRVPLVLALVLAVVGTASAAVLVLLGAMPLLAGVFMLVGLAAGLAYSLPPLALARRGWGEPLNALLGALLLPLLGVATIAATISFLDVVAFLPLLAVTFASVLATAWPDRVADVATGKVTLQVRLATPQLQAIALASAVVFVGSSVASGVLDAMPLAMAGLLVVLLLIVGLVRYTRSESPLPNVAAMVGLVALTSLALLASPAATA